MNYRTILFDLDGTLADTELVLIQTMIFFIQQYRPDLKVSLHELMQASGPPLQATLLHYFPDQDNQALTEAFAAKAREFYPTFAKPFSGAQDLISSLKKNHIAVGVVTSKLKRNALLTLDVIGMKDMFPVMITLDDIQHPKPHPEAVLLAMKRLDAKPESTLFIGDTLYDYHAGKSAGVDTGLVTWSMKKFSSDIKPTHWIDSFNQLKENLSR
jgi:pyrophosphatase PpaX